MFTSYKDILDLLTCPRCGAPLSEDGNALRCSNTPQSGECPAYDIRFNTPQIIDFHQSIIDPESFRSSLASSAIERHENSPLRSLIRRILFGNNQSAARNETDLISRIKQASESPHCLIVGGGTIGAGIQKLPIDPGIRTISLDVYQSPDVTFIADAHNIPLADQSMDAVWIQAVLEHVLEPTKVVREIYRVLKPGGIVYSETPFLQQIHEGAYDFTRFTHSGHRWLFRHFDEITSGIIGGAGTQLLWTIEHFTSALTRSRRLGKAAKTLFFPIRFLDGICDPVKSMDTASSFYFMGQRSDSPLMPSDMPQYYKSAHQLHNS